MLFSIGQMEPLAEAFAKFAKSRDRALHSRSQLDAEHQLIEFGTRVLGLEARGMSRGEAQLIAAEEMCLSGRSIRSVKDRWSEFVRYAEQLGYVPVPQKYGASFAVKPPRFSLEDLRPKPGRKTNVERARNGAASKEHVTNNCIFLGLDR
ncbi:hypothetical protein [Sphingobium sp. CR28]|uniref:hypothetical protein n=1 Tax=Sphingobium sp. CR28 TaxID=3400272 RepID=UPI003FEEBDFC